MKETRHRVIKKLENASLKSLSELLARRRTPRQLHRAWRLMAAVYAFCKRLPHNNSSNGSFVTERALYYHLKSTFTGQRSLNAALQRLTAALSCPRQ